MVPSSNLKGDNSSKDVHVENAWVQTGRGYEMTTIKNMKFRAVKGDGPGENTLEFWSRGVGPQMIIFNLPLAWVAKVNVGVHVPSFSKQAHIQQMCQASEHPLLLLLLAETPNGSQRSPHTEFQALSSLTRSKGYTLQSALTVANPNSSGGRVPWCPPIHSIQASRSRRR